MSSEADQVRSTSIEQIKIWKYEKLDILRSVSDISGCKLIEKYKKEISENN